MSDTQPSRQVSPKVLTALIEEADRNKTKVGEINGAFGERIKHHADASNLHTKAFRLVAQMHRMDELKREEFRRALDLYMDICEQELWGDKHTGDLVEQAKQPDEDADAAAKNGAALAKGIKPLDEFDKAAPTRAPGSYKIQ